MKFTLNKLVLNILVSKGREDIIYEAASNAVETELQHLLVTVAEQWIAQKLPSRLFAEVEIGE